MLSKSEKVLGILRAPKNADKADSKNILHLHLFWKISLYVRHPFTKKNCHLKRISSEFINFRHQIDKIKARLLYIFKNRRFTTSMRA